MPKSKISWASASADDTPEALNFWTWNCNKVSPGCKHCYAQTHSFQYPQNSLGGQFLGAPGLREKAFEELLLTKPGRVIFVNTHSDTFHEGVRGEWIRRIFQHMNQRQDLIFLLLTKRPQRVNQAYGLRWTDNIWLGTSIEQQPYYTPRMEALMNTPALHKFISFEPLLGAIVPDALLLGAEWIIAGGESGEDRRPFGRQWAVDLQQYAARNSIPFYFKQGSSIYPDQDRQLGGKTYDERPPQFAALKQRFTVDTQQATLF